MKDVAYDGTPIQGGMQEHSLTGVYPQFSILGVREMVVIGRRFKKDKLNRSRTQVEYTVRDLRTGDTFPGARRVDVLSGPVNGDDIVLHPAKKMRKGSAGKIGFQTPAADTDGDRVLVAFLEGSRSQPVIIGVFRHPDATYGAVEDDGERRLTLHMGTSVEFKSDGTYALTRGDTSVTVAPDQTVTVKQGSGSTITLKTNGDVVVDAVGDAVVNAAGDAEVTANGSVSLGATPLIPTIDGVVTGQAIDTLTGLPMWLLGHSSSKVAAKK